MSMVQLTGLDAGFLALETSHSPMHIGSLIVLDRATTNGAFTVDTLRRLLADRLHLIPTFRQRLAPVPLDLDFPYWIQDPGFDLDFHVRHIAVPPPGGMAELQDLAARIWSQALDRAKPLWEMYFVDGIGPLPTGIGDGTVALITKMHHAAVDGISGAEILATLLDPTPVPRRVPPPTAPFQPDPVPSPARLLRQTATHYARRPLKLAGMVPRAAKAMFDIRRDPIASGDAIEPSPLPFTAPRAPWNAPITPRRIYATATLKLETVKAVKNAAAVTVNDVVLTVVGGALRTYLADRNALPEAPLVAMAPISVRTQAQKGSAGNEVSAMLVSLASQIEDPVERLRHVRASTQRGKSRHKAIGADLLRDAAAFSTPALAALAARLYSRMRISDRHAPVFNTVVTNVPGPPVPLYLAGARVVAHFGHAPIIDGMGLMIVVLSYMDRIDLGFTACREITPDVTDIAERTSAALAELHAALVKPAPRRRRARASKP